MENEYHYNGINSPDDVEPAMLYLWEEICRCYSYVPRIGFIALARDITKYMEEHND